MVAFCQPILLKREWNGWLFHVDVHVQMADSGDGGRMRKLCLSGKAIRHCASSIVSSARQIASQRHHASSYRAYAEHSRALSRALTHLVHYLRSVPYHNQESRT